ncbi:MAG: RNA methyltransferase [Pseudomonadota bacterium]
MAKKGYFAIGAEGISKPMNFGNLARSAYGFGASFVFTVDQSKSIGRPESDTSASRDHLPWYSFDGAANMVLPDDCTLVGVELTHDAVDLPSFRHPTRAAYVLGPEGGSLSPAMIERCAHVVKIPTSFCINVAMAGAIVMYDRVSTVHSFAERPVMPGGPTEPPREHLHGSPIFVGGKQFKWQEEWKTSPSRKTMPKNSG